MLWPLFIWTPFRPVGTVEGRAFAFEARAIATDITAGPPTRMGLDPRRHAAILRRRVKDNGPELDTLIFVKALVRSRPSKRLHQCGNAIVVLEPRRQRP
jgi:hypothetical protein